MRCVRDSAAGVGRACCAAAAAEGAELLLLLLLLRLPPGSCEPGVARPDFGKLEEEEEEGEEKKKRLWRGWRR
jgi:hypothetical protein